MVNLESPALSDSTELAEAVTIVLGCVLLVQRSGYVHGFTVECMHQ